MAIRVPILFQLNKLGLVGATKELKKLNNQTKAFGLTSTLSIGAASAALAAYTKRSVAAAVADQKAQATLAQTLKNVGQAFATDSVTAYIDSLQRVTGVSEELLRPAFEKLVRATGDVSEAQRLLNLTLDITASTGKSTEAVSASLSKAFLGQTQALGRLGIGLTKAELKTDSFEQITSKLTVLFVGQAGVAAGTYAGQLNILGVAAQEASETIGVALIDSLVNLSGQNGVKDLAAQMDSLAQSTANVITNLGKVAKFGKDIAPLALTLGAVALAVVSIGTGGTALAVAAGIARIFTAKKFLVALSLIGGVFGLSRDFEGPKTNAAANKNENRARAEQAAKAAKARKTEITDRTKILGLTKAQAANEKLSRMFDMDAIQLAAALQGKLSKEDEARVKALQALKTEDKNDDIKALDDLETAKRNATFAEIARLRLVVEESKKANEEILADARARIAALSKASLPSSAAYSVGAAGSTFAPGLAEAQSAIAAGTFGNMGDLSYLGFDLAALGAANMQMESGIAAQQAAAPTNLTVNLQGGINVGSTYEFYQTVQTALQELNRAGNSLTPAGN
jgi:hypothetical protein